MAAPGIIEGLPDNPFWDYSLSIYGRSGFSQAAIALQDRRGVNVNLLLFCLRAGSLGQALDPSAFDRLDAVIAPWGTAVVKPLRAVRNWLKEQALMPAEPCEVLRRSVLARELEGEALEQWLITQTCPLEADAPSPETAANNLRNYCSAKSIDLSGDDPGDDPGDDRGDLAVLLVAAFPDLDAEAAKALLTP